MFFDSVGEVAEHGDELVGLDGVVGEVEFDLPGWAYPEDENDIILDEAV